MSGNPVAHAEFTTLQQWYPYWEFTKGGCELCLHVVSPGNALQRYLNNEVHDDQQDPTLGDGASHDVLILCRKAVRVESQLRQLWLTPFITRCRIRIGDMAVWFGKECGAWKGEAGVDVAEGNQSDRCQTNRFRSGRGNDSRSFPGSQ